MTALISVIIPVFNRASTVARAIDSVRQQSFTHWEVLIVDDASTDNIRGVLANYAGDNRIRALHHASNQGVSAARNSGIDAACGTYVAFLDSDDRWLPTKLERQVEAVTGSTEPQRAFCVTQTQIVMDDGWTRVRPTHGPEPGQSFAAFLYHSGGFAQASSFFVDRRFAAEIRFKEGMRQYEDHLFFVTAGARGGNYVLVPEPLSVWHNETRADRLSSAESLERARIFLAETEHILSHEERLAFELRTTFGLRWQTDRFGALKLLRQGVQSGALDLKTTSEMLIRSAAPARVYEWLRRRAA
jgi:glycosyltransferase involved in cell wall biosynthesis